MPFPVLLFGECSESAPIVMSLRLKRVSRSTCYNECWRTAD
jgi:hypothetical protein